LHIADARLLAKHSDSVLLVLRAGKTTRTAGLMAIQKFVADGSTILGTILTDWNPDQNGYGYDYKYYASHAAYYTDQAAPRDLGDAGAGGDLSKAVLLGRLALASVAAARYTRKLHRLLEELTPDVIHTNGFKMHILAAWAKPTSTPLIWHIHDYVSSRVVMAKL